MDEMAKHQPFIVAYLLAVEETMMSGNQRGQLMLIGLIVWKIFVTENTRLRSVTKEQLEGAEEANIRFLEELEAGSEMDHMSALQNLMSTYNQIEVLNAVIEALMSGHEVLAWIRGQRQLESLLVVVLTSSNEPSDVRRSYSLGANSYLMKPLTARQLVDLAKAFNWSWMERIQPVGTPPKP